MNTAYIRERSFSHFREGLLVLPEPLLGALIADGLLLAAKGLPDRAGFEAAAIASMTGTMLNSLDLKGRPQDTPGSSSPCRRRRLLGDGCAG